MELQISSFLSLVLIIAVWAGISEAASLMRKLQPRASSHQLDKRNVPDFVEWGCPDLNCQAVSDDCEMMEVIAFRYEHGECFGCPYCIDPPSVGRRRKRSSSSSSSSALYSPARSIPRPVTPPSSTATPSGQLDVEEMLEELLVVSHSAPTAPHAAPARTKANSPIVQNKLCAHVICPVAPPDRKCHHPGMLDGYLRNQKCISCPACLDGPSLN